MAATKHKTAESYLHPEADSPMRPEVGTQAQFKKKKPPQTYRYDSSLSPVLEWDGQNPARETGEALIKQIADCGLRIADLAKAQSTPERDKEIENLKSQIAGRRRSTPTVWSSHRPAAPNLKPPRRCVRKRRRMAASLAGRSDAGVTTENPIEEIWRIRDELAAEEGNDPRKVFECRNELLVVKSLKEAR